MHKIYSRPAMIAATLVVLLFGAVSLIFSGKIAANSAKSEKSNLELLAGGGDTPIRHGTK